MTEQRTIQEGDHVVFKRDDKCKVFQIFAKRQVFFEKTKLQGDQLVGQAFGTLFEVKQGKLVPVTHDVPTPAVMETVPSEAGCGKDNRNLVASEENQKLNQGDILKMKEQGLTGEEIVGKLVEQSETFKTKTEFSQEKYIKKKKKKHTVEFRVLEPNTSLLLETYKQNPGRICNLRADSLSQLLCYSNAMSGSTVAVVESCQGLLVGAVMERMGGRGRVLHLYPGNDMNRQNVRCYNFDQDHMSMLHGFPLNKLAALENDTLFNQSDTQSVTPDIPDSAAGLVTTAGENGARDTGSRQDRPAESGGEKGCDMDSQRTEVSSDEKVKSNGAEEVESSRTEMQDEVDDADDGECGGDGEKASEGSRGGDTVTENRDTAQQKRKRSDAGESKAERDAKKQERGEKLKEAASILQEKSLDSLIIATRFDPAPLMQRLLAYVAPSRCVAVFSQHKEPLVECYTQVREKGLGVQLKLSESWYREYQVLPSRTHPLMSMSGTGGYLLTFIRVAP